MSGSKVGLTTPRRRTPQSELAKAVRMMGAAAGQDTAKGLFGQSVTVSVGATTLSSEAGYDIHFEQVQFSYGKGDEKRNVMEGVSFTAQEGTTTAIVGLSGSGKTTHFHRSRHFEECSRYYT